MENNNSPPKTTGKDRVSKALNQFRDTLLNKKLKNAQQKYFEADQYLETINIEIITEANRKLTPFRNEVCKEPYCVFDIEDLQSRYKQAGFTDKYEFICEFCDSLVTLKKFNFDVTLSEGINIIWERYNQD